VEQRLSQGAGGLWVRPRTLHESLKLVFEPLPGEALTNRWLDDGPAPKTGDRGPPGRRFEELFSVVKSAATGDFNSGDINPLDVAVALRESSS
jgi:hypothetical protein